MKQEEAADQLGVKSTNPKDIQGMKKIPFHLVPTSAIAVLAIQMLDGGAKYGRENYRDEKVKASVYIDGALRHMLAWFNGRDRQADNGLRELGGVMACAAILIDAEVNGRLIDDRAYTNNYDTLVNELTEEVSRVLLMHKNKRPRHFSKLDILPTTIVPIPNVDKSRIRQDNPKNKRKKTSKKR